MAEEQHFHEELNSGDDRLPFEQALSSLKPHPSRLNRDRLMFLAGQASTEPESARPTRWLWPAATAVSTLAATVLAVLLAVQPEPRVVREVVREVVYVERPAEQPQQPREQREEHTPAAPMPPAGRSPEPLAHDPRPLPPTRHDAVRFGPSSRGVAAGPPRNYLELRERVLAYGIDALPERELPTGGGDGGASGGPVTYRELRESLLEDERRRERGAGSLNRSFNPFLFLNGGEPL